MTLDVSSLYTNIPHNEGIEACRKALNSSDHLSRFHLKTESMCDLMRMILTMNNFKFDNNYYIQLHGAAMGTRMAPAYANLFTGDLERKLLAQSPLKLLHTSCHPNHVKKSIPFSLALCIRASVPPLKNLNKEPVNYWNFCVSGDTNDSTFKPKSIKPFKFHVVTLYIIT